jgi:hypothetical protein
VDGGTGRIGGVEATNGEGATTEPALRARHLDALLEEALMGSFPASDPPAIDVEDRPRTQPGPVRDER